jgi:hypothetical protein
MAQITLRRFTAKMDESFAVFTESFAVFTLSECGF